MKVSLKTVLLLLVVVSVVDGRRRTKSTSTTTLTTTTTTIPSAATQLFDQQALTQTNYYRTIHCALPLTIISDLTTIAQNYAQYLCDNKVFNHSGGSYQGQAMGENLWMTGSTAPINQAKLNGSTPVISWYNEISQYDFSSPGYSATTGHFTQVVWASTQYLGIGVCCTSDLLACYVVGNYFPAGNYLNEFSTNVKQATCSSI